MIVDLSKKTIVITGAGGILGGNFAKHLARSGANVALLDINYEAAKKTADEIVSESGRAIAIACNVLDKQSVETAEKKVVEAFGEYHILINAAGGNNDKVSTSSEHFCESDVLAPDRISFFDLDDGLFKNVMDLNLIGTFIPCQVFTKGLMKVENPSIINISSMTSFNGLTKVVAYGCAKASVNNFTKWLTVHLAPLKIRVNAIAPGFFITNQNRRMMTNPDGTLTERSKKVIERTPQGRMGEPDDLIGLLLFLCDETASGYINGTIIPVDGGFMAVPGV